MTGKMRRELSWRIPMRNYKTAITLVFYYTDFIPHSWLPNLWQIIEKLTQQLNYQITHFGFRRYDGSGSSRPYKNILRNKKKLFDENSGEDIKQIHIYSCEESIDWFDAPFIVSVVNQYDDRGYNTLVIQSDLLRVELVENIANTIKGIIGDLLSLINSQYGFIDIIPSSKCPAFFYYNGPPSADYAEEEKNAINVWREEGKRFQTIMRDIYWGNILTRSHWGNNKAKEEYLLKAIEHECKENVFWIDENTLFFCAPFEICPQDDPKMMEFKERLYRVFDKLEIEVIGVHLDRYPEPEVKLPINLLAEDTGKKPRKLRSKKKLIIRYRVRKDSEETKENKCIEEILKQAGPLPLIIKPEKVQDGILSEIEVSGSKVPKVRQAIIYCIKKMNMDFEVNPPIDEEDSVEDMDFTMP
jgi:hypothetical protein